MLRILHTADWHIGNFPAPAAKTKQNLRFLDICAYIEFLIAKAKETKPDITIIAGDVFNQAKTWSDRGLQETNTIIKYISALADVCPVYILRGTSNHDGKMHFDLLTTAFCNDDDVVIIDEPCVKNVNNLAAIAFVPIFDRNSYRAAAEETLDKEAENNYFCDKVRDSILDLKHEADSYGLPTILVTHYTVLGALMPNGQTSIFANHEVVIDPLTLIQSDYWLTCLGHIHKPQKLEVCPNTFYSGSLCALTFNDENDPHGFYIHDIAGYDNISSEFIETPCRQFHTIWFDDAQLNDIISRDYDLTGYIDDSFEGSILRIIYTCSDITDKALNKASLEKAIYNFSNAFYIQEIVPEEIAITIDKTAMQNTSSVAENLFKYLLNERDEHGSISDPQINDCMAMAQPIIDAVTANATANHNIGVMTPVSIEVKNYRNYKHAVFDYSDVRFCVINGENGAGKSSLFMDAMLDALYEETREGDITGWISNDINARSGSIKFTFSIGDNIYAVTRTRQKSGKATLNLAQFITDADGNQFWNDMSEEKIKDTQAVINKLIGMNATTLKSCGLIMQDAYGLFLQADKNTRMDILGDILNLSIYDELSEEVAKFNQMCQQQLSQIHNEEDRILSTLKNGEEIQANLNEAFVAGNQYQNDLKSFNDKLLVCMNQRQTLADDINTHNRLCREIKELKSKISALNTSKEEQNSIIADTDTILAQEASYEEKLKKQTELTETEKNMMSKIHELKTVATKRQEVDKELDSLTKLIEDGNSKIQTLSHQKAEIELELASADDIKKKATLYEQTKNEITVIESRLNDINNLEQQLTGYQTALNVVNLEISNLNAEYNAKFDEIDKKIAIMTESGCPITEKATCRFLADARKAYEEKPILIEEYNAKLCELTQRQANINDEIDKLENNIAVLKKDLPDITAKKQELSTYEQFAFKASSLSELQKRLELCNQQIDEFTQINNTNISKKNITESILKDYNTSISELTKETMGYDAVVAELKSLENLAELGNKIAAAKATKVAALNRTNEITREIQVINFDVFDKTRELSNLKIDTLAINRIDADIKACKFQIDLIDKNIAENNKAIGRFELELKQYQADVRRLDKLKQLNDTTSYAASNGDWLKKAFARNGIPHNIVRSIIPVLQTTASNILGQMSGNTMSIELRTEKVLTTKKEVATLDIIVCDTVTGDLPYLSRSGGERVKAALSVVLALAEIKSSESGTQLGFLFIDEPPFLDSNGIEAYCDALEAIQKRYNNLKIMAITHDPEMKSRFIQNIDVIKTPDGSEIYVNL